MMTEQEHNNVQCTIFAQTERSSQIHLDDAEVQPKITQKRSGCVMNNVQWEKMKLGDIGKISMCKRVFSFETSTEGEIPFYKIGTFGKIADAFISKQLYEEYKSKFSYPKVGDILISASGTIGRTVVYDGEPAYFQDSNIIWIDNYEQIVLNQFLYYLYQTITWNLEGSTIARLYNDNFNKIEIAVPSLSAQHRIAAILSSADKVIDSTRRLIEKYKQMKQGMMEDLLKPKEGWKMVKLGEVGEIITGSTPPTTKLEYWNGEYNFYSPADFDDSVYCGKTERTVTKAGMDTGRRIPENSIMVACIASIGKLSINGTEGITNQQINTIVPKTGYDYIFLYYLLLFNVEKIKGGAAQTTIPIINKEDFSNLEFSVPDLSEQHRIAAILSGIDAKIAAEEKVLEKYEKVKKGLMERMLNSKN